jgi:hypothetical protein
MILVIIALLYDTVQFLLGKWRIIVKAEIVLDEIEDCGFAHQPVLIMSARLPPVCTNDAIRPNFGNRHLRPTGLQTNYITYCELSHIPS